MRRRQQSQPHACTVTVQLNARATLEISTTADHALQIVRGETVIPAKHVKVFDLDNNPLTETDLARLAKDEKPS